MRPRLLHLFNAFEVGGVERQHMMLVQRLAGDFDQACWSFNQGPIQDELDALGIVHRVGGGIEAAEAMLEGGGFDCVVSRTNRYLDGTIDMMHRASLPLVYMKDYLRWMDGNATYLDPERDARAAAIADAAFYCGPSLAPGFESFTGEGGGAALMYNGLDLQRFPLKPRSLSRNATMRIGIMANVTRRKNQLEAVQALKNELKDGSLQLELAGDLQEQHYADKIAASAQGLPVRLLGYVDDPIAFLATIDVFLLTSTLEGWPVAIMEAMASGVPVVAPAIGDIPELLEQGEAGLLYPCGEQAAIARNVALLRDPEVYARLSARGVERVRRFDIDLAHRQLDGAIRRVLARKQRSAA